MNTHSMEPEIVMAYHDGQLSETEASQVRAHLEQCAECRALAEDLGQVSRQMREWTVGPVRFVAPEIQARRPIVRAWMWQAGLGLAGLLVIFAVVRPKAPPAYWAAGRFDGYVPSTQPLKASEPIERTRSSLTGLNASSTQPLKATEPASIVDRLRERLSLNDARSSPGPMIIRTATLTLVTKDFANVRADVERIVAAHRGFVGQLETTGRAGTARSLSATLRIPSQSLDAAVAEIRKLGIVDQESRGGEEVTQQYTDLVARLNNNRNTEKRLTQVLAERTGKVGDVLQVEREIARVRGEIEQMEAEQRDMDKRVQYATITLRVTEEFKADLLSPAPSSLTRLWNALVDGVKGARETALDMTEFTLRYLPTLCLWATLLFLPVRWGWRRIMMFL